MKLQNFNKIKIAFLSLLTLSLSAGDCMAALHMNRATQFISTTSDTGTATAATPVETIATAKTGRHLSFFEKLRLVKKVNKLHQRMYGEREGNYGLISLIMDGVS